MTDWFWGVVSEAVDELRRSPQRGIPTPDRLERNGPLTTIILQVQIEEMLKKLVIDMECFKAVVLNWWVATQKDPFRVGRRCVSEEKEI